MPKGNTSVNFNLTGVVLSANWNGQNMLITASLKFIYNRRWSCRREQNLFVWIGKYEAKVTNNKRHIVLLTTQSCGDSWASCGHFAIYCCDCRCSFG